MIKMKLSDVLAADRALTEIAELDIAAQASWDLSKLAQATNAEVELFRKKQRKLLEELGEEREASEEEAALGGLKGKVLAVKPENKDAFLKRQDELLDVTVELGVTPFSVAKLGDTKVKPRLLFLIRDLLQS